MRRIVIGLFVLTTIFSCTKDSEPSNNDTLHLKFSSPPVSVPSGTRYAANISYNNNPNSTFDIFLPASSQPTALVVFIHGGGFVGGDKASIYSQSPDDFQSYLQNSIAFASINYQFRTDKPDSGIIISLNDIKRCIQFIRYNANSLNIDKARIGCYGGSAGGGASIYLAFHPEMADPLSPDPIQRESTRLIAAGHLTSQCSYDPTVMVNVFKGAGIDVLAIPGLAQSLAEDYGLNSYDQFFTDANAIALRKELDLIGWMSPDDPEFYVSNGNPNIPPTERKMVIHHPLNAKALDDKATDIGLTHVTNIPSMNIFPLNNETISKFMIRKLTQ